MRSWQAAYRDLLPADYLAGLRAEDRAQHYAFGDVDPARPATLVAVHHGAIIGFATAGRCRDADTDTAGELMGLYVDPPSWGTGTGRALIATARHALSGQGFPRAVLWVLAANERAQRFYRIDGWEDDGGRRRDTVWGIEVEELRYVRTLP